MFESVKGFGTPVVAAVLGASRAIYALGVESELMQDINPKWDHALRHPVEPRLVQTAPCKIFSTATMWISRNCPCPSGPWARIRPFTSSYLITKDPDTGVRNVGTYRMQVKGPDKTGLLIGKRQDASWHILKNNARN